MQILSLLSDILLLGATLGMVAWCFVLSRRLKSFEGVDESVADTVAGLAKQIEDLREKLAETQAEADDRGEKLTEATARADDRIGRMEMLLASLEDLEEETADRLMETTAEPPVVEAMPSFRAARSGDLSKMGR